MRVPLAVRCEDRETEAKYEGKASKPRHARTRAGISKCVGKGFPAKFRSEETRNRLRIIPNMSNFSKRDTLNAESFGGWGRLRSTAVSASCAGRPAEMQSSGDALEDRGPTPRFEPRRHDSNRLNQGQQKDSRIVRPGVKSPGLSLFKLCERCNNAYDLVEAGNRLAPE